MDSNAAHSPVFLLFPSDINSPEYQSSELTATTYKSQNLIQKFFVTKMKILGVSTKTCHNIHSTERWVGER
jgi:hypothetical protein